MASPPLLRPYPLSATAVVAAVGFFFFFLIASAGASSDPVPAAWPEQFHALLLMNSTGNLSLIDLWYDWTNGRNFNIIRDQLSPSLYYDLEWDNGTSFYYRLDPGSHQCRTLRFEFGILRPDWLDGAAYLGQRTVNGFPCNVWEKVDFITYFEGVATRRPVKWIFYTGREAHVMIYEEGAFLEDAKWQAPSYCFTSKEAGNGENPELAMTGSSRGSVFGRSAERSYESVSLK